MDDCRTTIRGVLARTPQWVRQDLGARDVAMRDRAEDALAAMIAEAIAGPGPLGPRDSNTR